MTSFKYKARDGRGELITGVLNAANAEELASTAVETASQLQGVRRLVSMHKTSENDGAVQRPNLDRSDPPPSLPSHLGRSPEEAPSLVLKDEPSPEDLAFPMESF